MKKLLHTLFLNIRYQFFHSFLLLAVAAVLINLAYFFIKWKKEKSSIKYFDYVRKHFSKNNIIITIITVCFIFPVWTTVLLRIGTVQHEPFSDVFGGWKISELPYFFDLSIVWNLVMLSPLAVCIYFLHNIVNGKKMEATRLAVITTAVSFFYSLVIELLQALFRVGTFQIADLVYNTLGGVIGFIAFILIKKIILRAGSK